MEESKALSPEVKGLFATVKSQAKEYTEAFERLSIELIQFEQLKTELTKVPDQIRYEVNNTIQELKKNFDESVELLEVKFDRISDIFNTIEDIRELRDELQKLSKTLNQQTIEINNTISNFKTRSQSELDNFIKETNRTIETTVEQLSAKTETKLNIKIRKIEGKLLTFDQKLWSVSNAQNYEFKNLLNDFENLKTDITDIQDILESFDNYIKNVSSKFIKDHAKELISDLLAIEKKEINDNINKIRQFFHQKNEKNTIPQRNNTDEATYFDDFSFDLNTIINKSNTNERLLNSLKKELSNINDQIGDLQKSRSIALIIAGISLSGMLLMALVLVL
jgi:ABC-type transporter Mla subunit MlaD